MKKKKTPPSAAATEPTNPRTDEAHPDPEATGFEAEMPMFARGLAEVGLSPRTLQICVVYLIEMGLTLLVRSGLPRYADQSGVEINDGYDRWDVIAAKVRLHLQGKGYIPAVLALASEERQADIEDGKVLAALTMLVKQFGSGIVTSEVAAKLARLVGITGDTSE